MWQLERILPQASAILQFMPDFSLEKQIWDQNYKIIAGCDEVGRGSFAGPVVAATVVFAPISNQTPKINDSKKLTQKQREIADKWIKQNSLAWGIGQANVNFINHYGIVKATNFAFRQAIKNTKIQIDYLLIDAFYIPYVRGVGLKRQRAIVKGDAKSISIAAASIIAKVYRDNLMVNLAKSHKNYNWESNKGYGTKYHRQAISKYGPTKYHRELWLD